MSNQLLDSISGQVLNEAECIGYTLKYHKDIKKEVKGAGTSFDFMRGVIPSGWMLYSPHDEPIMYIEGRSGVSLLTGVRFEIRSGGANYDIRSYEDMRGYFPLSKAWCKTAEQLARGILWTKEGFYTSLKPSLLVGRMNKGLLEAPKVTKYSKGNVDVFSVDDNTIGIWLKSVDGRPVEVRSQVPISGSRHSDVLGYYYAYICAHPKLYNKALHIIKNHFKSIEWIRDKDV